ncbi:MAG TPA: signal peptidase I [Campylobacterales bacterium]|nr:signal peptidase I [Campylobacterales bacterium]HHS92461.1 signal peptidase I [Campylobacterales bacterium]
MKFLQKIYRFASSWTGTIIIVLFLIFFVAQSFVIPSGSMKRTLHVGDFLFAKKFSYGTPIPVLPWVQIPLLPDFNNNGHLIEGERPKREDIVIFLYPRDGKTHYVKRCVATGGDEIVYQDKHLYIHFAEGDEYIRQNYKAEKIKKFRGKLWVDNPYMEKYPGIQYEPEGESAFVNLIYRPNDMKAIYVKELEGSVYENNAGTKVNAFYKKIEEDEFYMIGDNRDNSADSRFWGSVEYRYIIGQPWFIYFSWDNTTKSIRWDRLGTVINDLQFKEPRH